MVNEVYICQDNGGESYKIDLAPVNTIEDTYLKDINAVKKPVKPDSITEPTTIVADTRSMTHKFVTTGTFMLNDGDTTNGVTSLKVANTNDTASKFGRVRNLIGYGGHAAYRCKFVFDGQTWYGYVTRFTALRVGGENNRYDYILEVIEGVQYRT